VSDYPTVRVTADCAGTGQCVAVAPVIFELDVDGFSTVVGSVDTAERVAAARMAAQMCPMAAIEIDE